MKKRSKKKKQKNTNYFLFLSIIILLLGLLIVYYSNYSSSKKEKPVEELKYEKGDLYSPNASANMLDYLYNGNNILLSPLNANISLAILYNGTDNNSYKEIKKYFNNDEQIINEKMNTIIASLYENKKDTNANYEKYIKEFYNNKYNELKVKSINKLSQKEKDSLILLLIKIDLYSKQAQNKIKTKDIEKYKLSDKERKYNGYTIKSMIDNIVAQYETYTLENKVINYNELYYDTNKKYTINNDYLKTLNDTYKCNMTKLDYNAKDAKTTINTNLYNNTLNKINRVVTEEDLIDKDLIMINSLSFNYGWENNFISEDIADEEFVDLDGNHSMVEIMYSEESYYLENEQAIGFAKPFEGNKYFFIAVLPKKEGDFALSHLNLDSLLMGVRETSVYVGIPKMTISSTNDLQKMYKKYDIKEIFDTKANLHRMNNKDSLVSSLIQKETISIGEYGTSISLNKTENLSTRTIDEGKRKIVLNRPFVFLIINDKNEVLLISRINNPNQK